MGRRGPKPEPAIIKQQKGNPGHRPVGVDSSSASALAFSITPPTWLKTAKGKGKSSGIEVWNRLAPRLIALRLLTFADVETFARYCRNFGRWLRMNEIIDKEGETYETETYGEAGTTGAKLKRVNPAYLIADRLERQLLAAEDRFGLNPAERQRIFAARAQTSDPAARDLFGSDDKRPTDPAAKPTAPAEPSENPVGYLN